MNRRRIAALQAGLMLLSLFSSAAVRNAPTHITVLDSETHSLVLDNSGVPKNCDGVNFDAYCNNSKTVEVTNTLLVQEGDGTPFRIACTIDSKWSRCTPLPKGQSFDARKEKRGITIYYQDDVGKVRRQLYAYVGKDQKDDSAEPAAAASSSQPLVPSSASGPGQVSPAPVTATAKESLQAVKCSFTSTPSGAEVTVDGRYVGSTPSVLTLSTGIHVVAVSAPGFAQWKRDLTVSRESDLTVNAILLKAQ